MYKDITKRNKAKHAPRILGAKLLITVCLEITQVAGPVCVHAKDGCGAPGASQRRARGRGPAQRGTGGRQRGTGVPRRRRQQPSHFDARTDFVFRAHLLVFLIFLNEVHFWREQAWGRAGLCLVAHGSSVAQDRISVFCGRGAGPQACSLLPCVPARRRTCASLPRLFPQAQPGSASVSTSVSDGRRGLRGHRPLEAPVDSTSTAHPLGAAPPLASGCSVPCPSTDEV